MNPFLDMSEVVCMMKGTKIAEDNCRSCNKCIKEYYGLCIQCFKNPDWDVVRTQISTNKIKEASVAHYIVSSVDCGRTMAKWRVNFKYGSYFPDVMIDLGDRGIICEIDEKAHAAYNPENEEKRMRGLRERFARPLKIIRFNPDLILKKGQGACWSKCKDGYDQLYILHQMKSEWVERLHYIKVEIENFINLNRAEMIESSMRVEYLFYSAQIAEIVTPTTGSSGSRKKRTQ